MMCLALTTPNNHKTATKFVDEIKGLSREDREIEFLNITLEGHVPSWMKKFIPINIEFVDKLNVNRLLTINSLPDYLRLGTNDDSFIIPFWPLTAQRIADEWDCVLPTTKLVDIIWNNSQWKIQPEPWGPPYDHSMMSTNRIIAHGKRIDKTSANQNVVLGELIAGHKKDIVLTNKLITNPNKVAIYGWHRKNGMPIQPLYLGHVNHYGDYSHGCRLISLDCILDGKQDRLDRIMKDPILNFGISSEGQMQLVRQPLVN